MIFAKFRDTWDGLRIENFWSRIVMIAMACAIALMALELRGQEPVVAMVPPTLSEEAVLTSRQASEGYHKAWSLYVAQFLGNVSPGNAAFLREVLEPLLAPEVYEQTLVQIERQLDQIVRERISYSFEPREIFFDREENKVFVVGRHYVHRSLDDVERTNRTYEFSWRFNAYQPLLEYIDTYQGAARVPRR